MKSRKLVSDLLLVEPTADIVKAARQTLRLTQTEAGQLVGKRTEHAWGNWETGKRPMPAASWTLFCLATGLHPTYLARKRRIDLVQNDYRSL